jgi:hypothetical protein
VRGRGLHRLYSQIYIGQMAYAPESR